MKKYICSVCGYVYDEAVEKVKFSDLPDNWRCPICGAPKSSFKEVTESDDKSKKKIKEDEPNVSYPAEDVSDMRQLSAGELSALCSSLAKGCEKQYLAEESKLYLQLADYYRSKVTYPGGSSFSELEKAVDADLDSKIGNADGEAERYSDRGAKRVLLWSRKVSSILKSLLDRYEKEGNSILENTSIYVCEICGFVYIGNDPPAVCPVCKVPNMKFVRINREA